MKSFDENPVEDVPFELSEFNSGPAYLKVPNAKKGLSSEINEKTPDSSLAVLAKEGWHKATEMLLARHQSLVTSWAMKYGSKNATIEEKVAVAQVGFMNSIWHYKPEKSEHFIWYARYWMKHELVQMNRDGFTLVREPIDHYKRRYLVTRCLKDLQAIKNPTEEERQQIMKQYEIDEDDFNLYYNIPVLNVTYKYHLTDTDSHELDSFISAEANQEHEIAIKQVRCLIAGVLNGLDQEKQFIIKSRYGFLSADSENVTSQVVGDKLGITHQAVNQMQKTVLTFLKAKFLKLGFDKETLSLYK